MLKRMGDIDVKQGVKFVLSRIEKSCEKRSDDLKCLQPRLVAVGKTKPVEAILEAYDAGQRHFGENYVQELAEKASNQLILEKCKDIKWHFIGHLQTNKINKVLCLPNLYIIETVDTQKLADNLNKNWPKFGPPDSKLRVFVQVNTSGEKEKNGIAPTEVVNLTKHIMTQCSNLQVDGLMTIGQFGYNPLDGPNPDFLCLLKCREEVCKELNLDWKQVELSMGMSDDFEQAVELGSTNVRVGSLIFGYRPRKNE